MTAVRYYGCIREKGHYMWRCNPTQHDSEFHENNPWSGTFYSEICPGGRAGSWDARDGQAGLQHRDGWTALAFWDRSVDARPGSYSVFFAPGEHDFTEMMALARQHFPQVMDRLRVPVELAAPRDRRP